MERLWDTTSCPFLHFLLQEGGKGKRKNFRMGGVSFLGGFLFLILFHGGKGCALLMGVEAPKEVVIGGMLIEEEESVRTTAVRLAVDVINRDKCLLPGRNMYDPLP